MKTLKRTRAGRLEIATCYTQISKGDPARIRDHLKGKKL